MSTVTMTTTRKKTSFGWSRLKTMLIGIAWLTVVIISICYSIFGSWYDWYELVQGNYSTIETWTYVYVNFGSFILGVIAASFIFWRKPNDFGAIMASLMLVTFTSTETGFRFWYWLGTGEVSAQTVFVPEYYAVAVFFETLYWALFVTTLVFVLLTFPAEKFTFNWTRWLFILMIVGEVILIGILAIAVVWDLVREMAGVPTYWVYSVLFFMKSVILIPLALWQIYHSRKITNPLQRQQFKWVITGLIGMTLFYAIGQLTSQMAGLTRIPMWTFVPLMIFTYAFIISFFIAILRYRLWDIDLIINKTFVYAPLTAILTILYFAGAALLELYAELYFDESSPIISLGMILPLVVLFKPIRDGLQGVVDHYLKPEEIDFSGTMVEFTPVLLPMLSSDEIIKILVKQSIEQLNLTSATIFLKRPDGELELAKPLLGNSRAHMPTLDARMRERLESGKVITAPDSSSFSLLIPLIVRRAYKPDFLGVLALGPRHRGIGYSTSVRKSLEHLGTEAGKVIYITRLRENLGMDAALQTEAST